MNLIKKNLKHQNSLRLSSEAELFFEYENLDELKKLNSYCKKNKTYLHINHTGNNKKIPPTSNELLILYLASLSLTILWFIITKSHALCHPHFQPMLFLYSSFPLITIYFGRIIRDTFDFYIKK